MTTDDALTEATKIVTDWSETCRTATQRLNRELETFITKVDASDLSLAAKQAVQAHCLREMEKAAQELAQ